MTTWADVLQRLLQAREAPAPDLQPQDFLDQTPEWGTNPAYGNYYDNLLGAQQDLRDRARTAYLTAGLPGGPRMQFQPDAPLSFAGVNWYGPGEQPSPFEQSYRSWQHILGSLNGGQPVLPAEPPWMR